MRAPTKFLGSALTLVFISIASAATAATIPFSTCDPIGGANVDAVFAGAAEFCESESFGYTNLGSPAHVFSFDSGRITDELSFQDVLQDFQVNLTAFFVNVGNAAFLARIPSLYTPEVFDTTRGARWMYFRVEDMHGETTPPVEGVDYEGPWEQIITYFAVNNDGFAREFLHDNRPLNTFDATPITTFFDPHCNPYGCDTDPAIGGSADDFSDGTIVVTPEPASLLLLGSVLVGLVYQRRRVKR